jgi:hypothetical protein
MTCLHARAAGMTPGGSEPPGAGEMAGGEDGPAELPEDGPAELMTVAAPGPPAALPHPAAASTMTVSRPPIRPARFPAMVTTALR